jgi:hypothetical protein
MSIGVRPRHVWWVVFGLGLALLAACDVPEAPEWDVGIAVPFSSDPVAIIDFLPTEVRADTVNGQPVFTVDPQRDSVDYRLGDMCPACQSSAGQTIPVPEFEYFDSLEVRFPQNLVSVELTSARLGMRVRNSLNFDPLRPHSNPDSAGFIALVARDLASGVKLDSVLISGASSTFPSGSTLESVLDISQAQITDGVRVVFHIFSPRDTQTVTIDPNMSASVGGFLEQVQVAAVTAVVDNRTLEESFRVDVSESARTQLTDRVQSGSFELKLRHDLEVDGALEVSVAGSALDLFSGDPAREVRLAQLVLTPDIVQRGELTAAEIQLIGGFPNVYVGYRAVASGTRTLAPGRSNLSRFTPDQALQVELKVTSRLRVGR